MSLLAMAARAALCGSRDRLASVGWIQGAFVEYHDVADHLDVYRSVPSGFCAIGALDDTLYHARWIAPLSCQFSTQAIENVARAALAAALPRFSVEAGSPLSQVLDYNDRYGRTADEVIAVFDDAIALLDHGWYDGPYRPGGEVVE